MQKVKLNVGRGETIKHPIQRLIFLANRKIRIRYFGEIDIELVFIQ